MKTKYTHLIGLLCMAPISVNAGIALTLNTDTAGALTNGASWTGDGTITPSVTGVIIAPQALIHNTSGGTFLNVPMQNHGSTVDIIVTLIPAVVGMATSADISTATPSGTTRIKSISLIDMVNVQGIEFTYCFAEGLSPFKGNRPWGASTRATLSGGDSYNLTTTIEGIQELSGMTGSITQANANFGLTPPVQLNYSPGAVSNADTLAYTTTSTAVIASSTAPISNDGYYGTAGLDTADPTYSGSITESITNGMVSEESEPFMMNKSSIIIDSAGGAFDSGTEFGFTFNGSQWADTRDIAQNYVVPEPSSLLLIAAASAMTFTRRKR